MSLIKLNYIYICKKKNNNNDSLERCLTNVPTKFITFKDQSLI